MRRLKYNQLRAWKNQSKRMPLILRGARQVGKSYLLSEFGKKEFAAFHHFDFDKDRNILEPIFKASLSPDHLFHNLSLIREVQISPEQDLVIFDEIQNCPEALTSLKYFCEERPNAYICAAGSLLGISLTDRAFPVGKITYLDLHPLNFEEFLMNSGHPLLHEEFCKSMEIGHAPEALHSTCWNLLKEFYVTGGMPLAVKTYFEYGNDKVSGMQAARRIQTNLVESYASDFSKHSGKTNALHIRSVFENVPQQLASHVNDSTKRFRFKDVIPGKTGYRSLEGPIDWLIQAGLIYKVPICQRADLPLKAFTKPNIFKLYLLDIGLLGAMLELSPATLITQDYGLFKGFFAENYVATEFAAAGERTLYSWAERNSEIEFLADINGQICPIEVKAGHRTKAQSLRQFFIKYNPESAVMISGKPLDLGARRTKSCPLYYAGKLLPHLRA